jgi:hypothetical protein
MEQKNKIIIVRWRGCEVNGLTLVKPAADQFDMIRTGVSSPVFDV